MKLIIKETVPCLTEKRTFKMKNSYFFSTVKFEGNQGILRHFVISLHVLF